jgi:hypothetical protein
MSTYAGFPPVHGEKAVQAPDGTYAQAVYGTEGQRFESSRARLGSPRKRGSFAVLGMGAAGAARVPSGYQFARPRAASNPGQPRVRGGRTGNRERTTVA